MVLRLLKLEGEFIDEHICERYIELESRTETLKQDLGIVNSGVTTIDVDFEPSVTAKRKSKKRDPNEGLSDRYYLEISQAITSLHSSKDNDNSTTGFVLWSTTPFFIRWLLYDPEARPFRAGGYVGDVAIPPILSSSTAVVELGGGTSGILPIVLGNYVAAYICTDQKGLINGMKSNITRNLLQLNKRRCVSKSLQIDSSPNPADTKPTVNLETIPLDWENPHLDNLPEIQLASNCSTIYIVAMDVIYNDYLIDPFLETLSGLLQHFQSRNINIHCLIGVHMRAQEVVTDFLNKAMLQYNLPVHYIDCDAIRASRFSIYFI
ncbi:hypothetical protein HG537_0H01190 [Torulaspora globosa]|uniref:Ribosomal lysine N-methyltransferase 5 n=1 Tax=Torulaspora globosa TaxID=48254 RepID=A0A7H9HX96_9SACH|nr:hypothetical protein HG537_0H01190 [Torulaspora sp. CBS 2947]